MLRLMILYVCGKYETYFDFNEIDKADTSNGMVQKYQRLQEIYDECLRKNLSDEEAHQLFGQEVEDLSYAIKCKEFVCKVSRVAYLGGMKIIAEFWGDYYTEIDFEDVLLLPEVRESYPELEKLRNPEVFHKVYPAQYHVFFGERPERVDVSSDFIWHFGKQIKGTFHEENYDWVRGW